jgi:hypothetical protein
MVTIRKRDVTVKSAVTMSGSKKISDGVISPSTPDDRGYYNEHNIWVNGARMSLELRFDQLVYKTLPRLAKANNWVIRFDHCFMRILYDNAFGDAWYKCLPKHHDRVLRRIPTAILMEAVRLGDELVLYNGVDLDTLNAKSLEWRRASK